MSLADPPPSFGKGIPLWTETEIKEADPEVAAWMREKNAEENERRRQLAIDSEVIPFDLFGDGKPCWVARWRIRQWTQ
jgi:hypothetical protein